MMFGRKKTAERNLMEMIPVRCRGHEVHDDGTFSILEPRFHHQWSKKLFARATRTPQVKIHLDEVGTFTWEHIDGKRPLHEIATLLEEKFGDRAIPAHDRLARFVVQLKHHGFVDFLET